MGAETDERIAPALGDPHALRAPPRARSEKKPWTLARKLKWLALGLPLGAVLLSVLAVVTLRWLPPATSAFMLQQRLADWREDRPAPPFSYQWVPWSRISESAKLAAIAAEDQKFAEHHGFDMDAIFKALDHNRSRRKLRGASTISQQVAKNLFLWPQRSWLRKGLEVYFTLLIEVCWPKQRILEVYLNIAEFGPNTYGVEAAAQRYWRKPAARLSAREAALLAAVLPSPRRLRAQSPSAYVQSRATWIEGQMRQLGAGTLREIQGS